MVLVEMQEPAHHARLQMLQTPVVAGGVVWKWIDASEIARPRAALCHAYDNSLFYLVRAKREKSVWQ